jgi:methylthioribose-1-phosphate isomerase
MIRTVYWDNDAVVMIDQKALPVEVRYISCRDYREVVAAIKGLTVRGAPAIGVAAALGIALGVQRLPMTDLEILKRAFYPICDEFACSRPTARNLFWAIERMTQRFSACMAAGVGTAEVKAALLISELNENGFSD